MGILKDNIWRSNKIILKKYDKILDKIDKLEIEIEKLTDEELRNKTNEFKSKLNNNTSLDDLLPEAFAVVREASKRVLGMKQHRVQLLGGIVLHEGKIAEMKTGEGKTLTAVAPVYLNSLTGKGVHVITVNEYLANRDKEKIEPLYNFLGVSVGVILSSQDSDERKIQYKCDVTYGTNDEFGFDYLRDNMCICKEDIVQRNLNFAIIDEVDSIFIDEARTPLIISGEIKQETKDYNIANVFVKFLLEDDYEINKKDKTISLTERGIKRAEQFYNLDNLTSNENSQTYHHINKALHAFYLMDEDKDYIVKDDAIEIIDEFTGRVMKGRRFSEGLHQAIEAKENLEITNESKTLATITYQNYFRLYNKISGMTGTAKTEELEFNNIYNLEVIQIPTNKPVIRQDLSDKIYKTELDKFEAIVDEIEKTQKKKQPMLIGTTSIEKSEILSKMLYRKGIDHKLLNAKNDEEEAKIIAEAGKLGAITIATNMAGRGTDIILGGGNNTESSIVKELGGLYVIGTEHHENRRIDNQLRGRSGRQGDPGISRFFISLEDEIMKLYGNLKNKKIESNLPNKEITNKYLLKYTKNAQISLESKNFEIRKQTIKYDDVINKQRLLIYKDRNKILNGESVYEEVCEMIKICIEEAINEYSEKDQNNFINYIKRLFNLDIESEARDFSKLNSNDINDIIYKKAIKMYIDKEEVMDSSILRKIERETILYVVDKYWTEHIDQLDQLRQGIGLSSIGQKDPIKEFTIQSFDMLDDITKKIRLDIVHYLFNLEIENLNLA